MSLAVSSTQHDYYNCDSGASSEAESGVGTESDSDTDESSYELETSKKLWIIILTKDCSYIAYAFKLWINPRILAFIKQFVL